MRRECFLSLLTFFAIGFFCACVDAEESVAQEFVPAETEFALDVYRELVDGNEDNFCFSPLGVSVTLGILSEGAAFETRDELIKALHIENLESPIEAIAEAVEPLNLFDPRRAVWVNANSMWIQTGNHWNWLLVQDVNELLGADFFNVDFLQAPRRAMGLINQWSQTKSDGRVARLLARRDLDRWTRFVVANAVFMDARWRKPFKKSATNGEPFVLASGRKKSVATMSQETVFPYLETESFEAVQLDYQGFPASMVVFLPKDNDGLAAMETELKPHHLQKYFELLDNAKPVRQLQAQGEKLVQEPADMPKARAARPTVKLFLPKFRISQKHNLKETLSSLGIQSAFDSDDANFSALFQRQTGPLFLQNVIQEAMIEVDEEGTRATAVTGGGGGGFFGQIPNVVEFRVDHPFLYIIRAKNGLILFMGRVTNPSL